MDIVTSSSDSKSVRELASDVTAEIFYVELRLESMVASIKQMAKDIKVIKHFANETHAGVDEERREEILGDLVFLEDIKETLTQMDFTLEQFRDRVKEHTDA